MHRATTADAQGDHCDVGDKLLPEIDDDDNGRSRSEQDEEDGANHARTP